MPRSIRAMTNHYSIRAGFQNTVRDKFRIADDLPKVRVANRVRQALLTPSRAAAPAFPPAIQLLASSACRCGLTMRMLSGGIVFNSAWIVLVVVKGHRRATRYEVISPAFPERSQWRFSELRTHS
jgi:hypothetical protein